MTEPAKPAAAAEGGSSLDKFKAWNAGFCPAGQDVKCTEQQGNIIFYCNIISPGWGTCISSFWNTSGCNWHAYGLGIVQSCMASLCCLGWYMSYLHGLKIKNESAGKK